MSNPFRPRLLGSPHDNPSTGGTSTSNNQSNPNKQRAKLPRDAHVSISTNPAELYISLTIRRPEHIQALLDTLQTFAPMLEDDQ